MAWDGVREGSTYSASNGEVCWYELLLQLWVVLKLSQHLFLGILEEAEAE